MSIFYNGSKVEEAFHKGLRVLKAFNRGLLVYPDNVIPPDPSEDFYLTFRFHEIANQNVQVRYNIIMTFKIYRVQWLSVL